MMTFGAELPERQPFLRMLSNSSISTMQAGSTTEAPLEWRITSVEAELKAINVLLKEQQQDANGLSMLRDRAQRMCSELEQTRNSRKAFQERADRLEALLRQERQEREAWLASFSSALGNTLTDLSQCIDKSVSESNRLMRGRLDNADSLMEKLMHRVDQIFSTRDAAGTRDRLPLSDSFEAATACAVAQRDESTGSVSSSRVPSKGARAALYVCTASERDAASLASTPSLPSAASAPSTGTLSALPGSRPESTALSEYLRDVMAQQPQSGGVSDPGTGILESWTELMNENSLLQQRHGLLMSQKRQLDLSRGSQSPGQRSSRSPSATGPLSSPRETGSGSTWSPLTLQPGTRPRSVRPSSQLPIVEEL